MGIQIPSEAELDAQDADNLLKELMDEEGISALEDSGELSFHDLYKNLLKKEEIILVLERTELNKLRKGLSGVKAKHTAKCRESNVPIDRRNLEFIEHPHSPDMEPGEVKIAVILKPTPGIKVRRIIIPSGEL